MTKMILKYGMDYIVVIYFDICKNTGKWKDIFVLSF